MDSVYYKVIGFVLFFPWFTVALMVLGYFRGRWAPRRMTQRGVGILHGNYVGRFMTFLESR
jgi:hypothetical protein